MSTRLIDFTEEWSETVNAGDTLVVMMPKRRDRSMPAPVCTIGVYPEPGASTTVEQSCSSAVVVKEGGGNWSSPTVLGTVTSDTASKVEVFEGVISAIKIASSGGNCVVEGRY